MEIDAVSPVTEQTAPVGMSEQSDTVHAADLYTPDENGASAQETNVQTDAPVQQTEERRYTSDEMSATVRKRLDKEHEKAAWKLGSELLKERMQADNIDEAEALKRIREDRIKAKAAQFKDDPEKGFAELMRMREQPEDTPTSDGDVQRVYNEIVQEINDGKVPQGFNLTAYLGDPERAREFLKLREAVGMERACALVMPQQPVSKTELNRSLPQTIGTNNSYSQKKIDYSEMSSEDFRAMDEKIKKMYAAGKRVEI